MTNAWSTDRSSGYDGLADEFMLRRSLSSVGVATVREWAGFLPQGAAVLDLGCGHGTPISAALAAAGAMVYGVDASPRLVAAFRARFPDAPVDCNTVEESEFFGRNFDAVVAWGLMFLLMPEAQAHLIEKVSAVLKPGGQFLFTSPREACEWSDTLTGRKSVSLGAEAYRGLLKAAGLSIVGTTEDEGHNYYHLARKHDGSEGAGVRASAVEKDAEAVTLLNGNRVVR